MYQSFRRTYCFHFQGAVVAFFHFRINKAAHCTLPAIPVIHSYQLFPSDRPPYLSNILTHLSNFYTLPIQTPDSFETKTFFFWRNSPQWARASSFTRFLDHTHRRTTAGSTPLNEWSARRSDLYLTSHNTHNKHPCPRWDSKPQSQQASGRRPKPWTTRPLGPAKEDI